MARNLTDPGTLLATTHPVADGRRVRLRLARPSDGRRVHELLERLSEEPRPADTRVRRLTYYDPRDRLVLAATSFSGGGEHILGLAQVPLRGTKGSELEVLVDEEARRQGVAGLLAEAAGVLAARQGVQLRRAA